MAITPLPSLDRTSATFKTDVDTFFSTKLPTFSTEAEAARSEIATNAATASTAATTATNAATTATTQAATATNAASTATTQAGNASTSAAAAATSAATASSAATTATNAANSATAAAASVDVSLTAMHAATSKATPVDADETPLLDSAASFGLKKLTWANIKATLKTYFDTLYGALGTVNTFTKAQRGAVVTLTDATTIALDLSLGNQYAVRLGGNRTLGAPTNAAAGQSGSIEIVQDTTGSRTLAYAWPYVWASGTAGTLSTVGCSLDQLVYEVSSYASSAVSITIAAPGVVSWTGHGLVTGQRVQLTTTGALPTGLSANTTYYWTTVDANSGKLSTSLANCAAGTFITTSGTQSGTHTMTAATIKLALNKAYA